MSFNAFVADLERRAAAEGDRDRSPTLERPQSRPKLKRTKPPSMPFKMAVCIFEYHKLRAFKQKVKKYKAERRAYQYHSTIAENAHGQNKLVYCKYIGLDWMGFDVWRYLPC